MRSFALLRLGQTRLLIPQSDVRVLELRMDMTWQNPPPGGVGWIRFREKQHPVYLPSPQLEWLAGDTEERTICALLEADEALFGLLCHEVSLVRMHELTLHAMPAAMATPDSPFHQLAMHDGRLACLSSAANIFALLPPAGSEA